MKEKQTIFDKLALGACGLALAAALLAPPLASASGYLTSLQITNALLGTNVLTSYPTNTYNPTNGIPQLTGRGVYIGNVRDFGFNVQGFLINTGIAQTCTFTLVTSMAGGGGSVPNAITGTNVYSYGSTVLTANDWQSVFSATNASGVLIGYPVVFTLPGFTTNWFNWSTNLDVNQLKGANWVGVYSISNSIPNSSALTNAAAYINTKLIPAPINLGN